VARASDEDRQYGHHLHYGSGLGGLGLAGSGSREGEPTRPAPLSSWTLPEVRLRPNRQRERPLPGVRGADMICDCIIAVSTLAALASLGLWFATSFAYQITVVPYTVGDGSTGCVVNHGTLNIVRSWSSGGPAPSRETRFRMPGLCEVDRADSGDLGCWSFDVRLWLLFVLLAAYPGVALVRWLALRRRRRISAIAARRRSALCTLTLMC